MLFALKFTSPLRDVSHLCDVSIIDLSKMIILPLAWKASEKILPVKTITQGKSKPLAENILQYTGSASLVLLISTEALTEPVGLSFGAREIEGRSWFCCGTISWKRILCCCVTISWKQKWGRWNRIREGLTISWVPLVEGKHHMGWTVSDWVTDRWGDEKGKYNPQQEYSISNFPCSLTRNMTSHSMGELGFP